MSSVTGALIGREQELEAIVKLLDARDELPRALVLHGDAGIGKTAIWLTGIEAAAERGFRILSCRPSEAETRFAYAGLTDLLGPVAEDVLPLLPPIQRRSLEAALLLGESDAPADERAVAASFLAALSPLAAQKPLLLAVDDLQWLDPASLAAVRFALPRLVDQPVAMLFAARGDVPSWLHAALPETEPTAVEPDGLSLGAMRELLRIRLDAAFSRPMLINLHATSAGNPFFALELARAVQRRGATLDPGEPLPIPGALQELIGERVEALRPAALEVARVVAAVAEPTVGLVDSVREASWETELDELLDARILELDGERLRFTHPLLASAVGADPIPTRRRTLHGRLAEVVPTAEERARHLALATVEPNAEIAAVLEDAARSAHARGAPAEAAELAEQARRLTPATDRDDARRRIFLAADRLFIAGNSDRARALLEETGGASATGRERAAVLTQLARMTPDIREAVDLYREALSAADAGAAVEAEIHLNLASLMRFNEGVERGLEHAELAVAASARTGDPALRCRALAAYGLLHFNSGRGIPRAEMDEALALERLLPDWPLDDGPADVACHQLWWSGDVDSARALLREIRDAAGARNETMTEAGALWYLALVEWRAGHWDEAERHAAAALELMTQIGHALPPEEFPAAVVDAHRGRLEDARDRARRALARADAEGMQPLHAGFGWVLGFVELSRGDLGAALPLLRHAYASRAGIREPAMRFEVGDLVEALVAAGELDEARAVISSQVGSSRVDLQACKLEYSIVSPK